MHTESTDSSSMSVETVTPWNNRLEDRLVFSLIGVILLIAVVLLQWLYPAQISVDKRVPGELRHALTTLGNAAEEILMLSELDGHIPLLSELADHGITPFAEQQWPGATELQWHQFENCFIGDVRLSEFSYQLRLQFSVGELAIPYLLSWRPSDGSPATATDCRSGADQDWKIIDNRADSRYDFHAH
ncbi:MAG: hypothetical protein AAF353_13445 [Pseudomonadota bacterium]